MLPFTLRQLEIFREIARQGGVTPAAAHLRLTQSAASMALAELERALGRRLFNRAGRVMTLNDEGRRLLAQADAVLDAADDIACSPGGDAAPPGGKITLGCSTTIAGYILPPRLAPFLKDHPGIEPELRAANTEGVLRLVHRGEVDIGLVEGEVDAHGLETRDWLPDEIVAVCAPDDPLAARRTVTAKTLAKRRWLMREGGSGTYDTVMEELGRRGERPSDTRVFGDTEAIKGAVRAGLGLAWLSAAAVAEELAGGRLARVHAPFTIRRRFRILLLPARRRSALIHATLAWLEAEAAG